MSLTLFVGKKEPIVTIVTWFSSINGAVNYASGPLICFETDEFRRVGWEFVREHFVVYQTRRLGKENTVPVLQSRSEKGMLANQLAIRIEQDPQGNVWLLPQTIEKLSLSGLRCLPVETERRVPMTSSGELFWAAFDEALAEARKHEQL